MAYITKYNLTRVSRLVDSNYKNKLKGKVYKKDCRLFSYAERQNLLFIKALVSNCIDESISDMIVKYDKNIERKDSYSYLYEKALPCYHENVNCSFLRSDYLNFTIPKVIKSRGEQAVIEFRKWFKGNLPEFALLDPDVIELRITTRWGISIRDMEKIKHGNSSVAEMANQSIAEIEAEIDRLLVAADNYKHSSLKNKMVLAYYATRSHLIYKDDVRLEDWSGCSHDETYQVLRYFNDVFKTPLKKMLTNYYCLIANDSAADANDDVAVNVNVNVKLLEQLNFKPCKSCCNTVVKPDAALLFSSLLN